MKNVKKDIKEFYSKIASKKEYYLPILFIAILAFGFNLFNRTVGVDDLAYKVFGEEDHYAIKLFRWGIYVLYPILHIENYTPFIGRFIALTFLILSAVLASYILYIICGRKERIWKYTLFSCFFISYPLINEAWEYNWECLPINYNGIPFFFCLAFISIIYQIYSNFSLKTVIVSGLILAPVMSGYESVIFFYISFIFIVLIFKNLEDQENNWFVQGLKFAAPLVIALALRYIIGYILIYVFGLQNCVLDTSSRTQWATLGLMGGLKRIIYNGYYYLIRCFSYFPILEFVVSLLIYILLVIKKIKVKNHLLLSILLVISLFFLSFIQGDYLYYRTAQTIQLFVSFVCFYVLLTVESASKKIYSIIIVILFMIVAKQGVNLHTLLALNNQRSENESFIARTIGYKLYSEFDISKTVIFCGEYKLGSFIQDQIVVDNNSVGGEVENAIRKLINHNSPTQHNEFVLTNVNSYFNLQMDAFNGQTMLKNYLSYFGYDINVLENLSDEEEDKLKGYYEKIAIQENMKPFEIKDMGEYILVYLGPTVDRAYKLKY